MDSFEWNKIAGAVLGTLLFVMGGNVVAQGIYARPLPKVPGYDLPALKEAALDPAAAAAAAAPEQPLPILLAKADATRGETDAKACGACHNFQKGAAAKVGPPLYGVVNREKGAVGGFQYSEGLKGKGGEWTFAAINEFITNPKGYIAGTKMAYGGEKDAGKRAEILAYLRTLADSPPPLPVADATPAAAAKPAAAPAGAAPASQPDKQKPAH